MTHRQQEGRKRLERIHRATPPATTIDGQLQRMRDRNRAAEDDDVDDRYVGEDHESEDAGDEDEPGDEVDDSEDIEPEVVHPAPRPRAEKPGHRQPAKAPERATGQLPWWARTAPGQMTRTAEGKVDEMTAEARRRGIKVEGRINA